MNFGDELVFERDELVFERFDLRLEPIDVVLCRDGLGQGAGQSLGGRPHLLRESTPPEVVHITELIEKNLAGHG